MKKYIIIGLVCALVHRASFALSTMCYIVPEYATTADSSCTTICSTCAGSFTGTMPTGYTGTVHRAVITSCNSDGTTYSCECGTDASTTFKCATGYYGTAKYRYTNSSDQFTGCYKCPENATCTTSGFTCNQGYYANRATCVKCPSSGGTPGTTAGAGATSITACYIPYGMSITDETGSYIFTSHCYYTN